MSLPAFPRWRHPGLLLAFFLLLTGWVYWPGLAGGWLFDDYPNIVDNPSVQPARASVPALVNAALSSPASEFKRPLASLSFAANFLATGLDPFGWKLVNLIIHLLNGVLVYLLARRLLVLVAARDPRAGGEARRIGTMSALIAGGWLLLPINLTGVLYVVQRMESLANLCVLAGLLGYVAGRQRMRAGHARGGLALAVASLLLGTGLGLLVKETAVMLPLYAAVTEWVLFDFRRTDGRRDFTVIGLFVLALALPLVAGLAWLLPHLLAPAAWATRDFTLTTRLLSEARIVAGYLRWTLLPTPGALSFYHDDFRISTGLLTPWTTLPSLLLLIALAALAVAWRRRRPLVALGLMYFLGCHLLTGTILPLELIYEHRNYFASLGLLLALVPPLCAWPAPGAATPPFALARRVALLTLFVLWTGLTALTARAWSSPLRLAEELAARAPQSPRAQYELGRTYIIYSHYDRASPFTRLAYAPLERAAALPGSSILPEQALIFMNARMGLPLKDAWWDSMIAKLKAHPPGVQDESSLAALVKCARDGGCPLPKDRMVEAFLAALSHPDPSARLLASYGDYAWNVLGDRALGLRLAREAVTRANHESAYRITLIRMLLAEGHTTEAREALAQLQTYNIAGRLDATIAELRRLFPAR